MEFVGEVERVLYHHNGWGVFLLRTENTEHPLVKACGAFLEIHPGSHLQITGAFENHPKHGQSFKVQTHALHVPTTTDGMKRYLAATLPGIGMALARAIVDTFGEDTIKVITDTPDRLLEIPRLHSEDLAEIKQVWKRDHMNREIIVFLSQFGLSRLMCERIIAKFGREAKQIITEDPYILTNVGGLGFIKVDRVALKMGIEPNGKSRRRAALMYVLHESSRGEGHVYLSPNDLCYRLLRLELEGMSKSAWSVDEAMSFARELQDRDQVVVDDDKVYLGPLYYYEKESARILLEFLERPINPDFWMGFRDADDPIEGREQLMVDSILAEFIEEYQAQNNVEFSEEQIAAIALANRRRVVLITGLPGTGKTTVMRAIAQMFSRAQVPTHLCAPTGKAAKRMSEVSGRSAQTIHRLMGLTPEEYGKSRALEPCALLVDEFSMVDISLLCRLLRAMPPESHLVMIGDPAQLPSVGPGYVLHDLKRSGKIPTVHLDKIFRQAEKSDIIKNAHHIHRGEALEGGGTDSDFNIYRHTDDQSLLDVTCKLVQRLLTKRKPDDFQVLAPMKKGLLGVENLNKVLRPLINPMSRMGDRVVWGELDYAVGDRVLITKNDYEKRVFNGDSGTVRHVDPPRKAVYILVDGNEVSFYGEELNNLTHAYALTIHKSQGSEWPIVLVALSLSHARMLERNLFYTGVTRARQRVMLLCNDKAVSKAVATQRAIRRNTTLVHFLTEGSLDPVGVGLQGEFEC